MGDVKYMDIEMDMNLGDDNINEENVTEDTISIDSDIETSTDNNTLVEFASDTDATLYTVSTTAPPSSSAEQSTIYLLEIRNLLLIFLLGYFVLIFYSKIKNLFINFFDM